MNSYEKIGCTIGSTMQKLESMTGGTPRLELIRENYELEKFKTRDYGEVGLRHMNFYKRPQNDDLTTPLRRARRDCQNLFRICRKQMLDEGDMSPRTSKKKTKNLIIATWKSSASPCRLGADKVGHMTHSEHALTSATGPGAKKNATCLHQRAPRQKQLRARSCESSEQLRR